MHQREKRFDPGSNVIEVSQWDKWKLAQAPDIIETTGLGPCIGVIVFDPTSRQALVGHFMDPRVYGLTGMLDEALRRFADPSALRIYVGGGAPNPYDAPHFSDDKAKRAFVKQQLSAHGFLPGQVTIRYHDSDDTTVLRIDTSTGEVEYVDDARY